MDRHRRDDISAICLHIEAGTDPAGTTWQWSIKREPIVLPIAGDRRQRCRQLPVFEFQLAQAGDAGVAVDIENKDSARHAGPNADVVIKPRKPSLQGGRIVGRLVEPACAGRMLAFRLDRKNLPAACGVAQNIRKSVHTTPRSRNVCEVPNMPSFDGCTSGRASNSLATRSVTSPAPVMYQRNPSLPCIFTKVAPPRSMSAASGVEIGFRFLVRRRGEAVMGIAPDSCRGMGKTDFREPVRLLCIQAAIGNRPHGARRGAGRLDGASAYEEPAQ